MVLAGLLLLACLGCGDGGEDGERFEVYHLELAIGPPGDDDGELRCGPPRIACPGVVEQPPPRMFRYATRQDPALTGDDILRDTARAAGPAVTVELTAAGRVAFARVTRRAARLGGRDQGWHHVAIVVGDEIVAFPQIDFDEYPDGIADASSLSIRAVDPEDARRLVRRIRGD